MGFEALGKKLAQLGQDTKTSVQKLGESYQMNGKINEAKKILAFEVTKIVHGEEKALAAQKSAEALFGAGTEGEAPVYELAADEAQGMRIVDILAAAGLAKSKSEARKLVEQGAVLIDGEKVSSIDFVPDKQEYLLRRGKKQYKKIIVK